MSKNKIVKYYEEDRKKVFNSSRPCPSDSTNTLELYPNHSVGTVQFVEHVLI